MPRNPRQRKNIPAPRLGSIAWADLTVPRADNLRGFYQAVAGWTPSDVNLGTYSDYAMTPSGRRKPVAGLCHARGSNAALPPQWLIYITVADAHAAAKACRRLGGRVLDGPRTMGGKRFACLRDPAGAVFAVMST